MRLRSFVLFALILLIWAHANSQVDSNIDSWRRSDPGFRAVGITSNHSALWVCGVGEGIASTTDGQHWEIKHHQGDGGALLLGIGFASDTFGYAYGTNGTFLTTEDGGSTWLPHHLGDQIILLASSRILSTAYFAKVRRSFIWTEVMSPVRLPNRPTFSIAFVHLFACSN